MDRVFQIERFGEGREIVGVGVHVIAVPRLAGAAMPAPVMRDATVTVRCQKKHLVFESIAG